MLASINYSVVIDLFFIFAFSYSFRVVVTQLGADLTKQIVITDPYRIKVFFANNCHG